MPITSTPFALQGIALIVLGAFIRAIYVINNKRNLRRISPRFMIVINMLGSGLLLLILMFLLAPPHGINWFSWPAGILWPLAATALMNIIIQYSELKALQHEDASLVIPMSAASPLLSLLSGFIILREIPTAAGWVGVVFLSIGSYVLNIGKPASLESAPTTNGFTRHLHTIRNFLIPWTSLAKSRGVRLALLGALMGSISINFDKIVASQTTPLFLPGIVMTGVGLFMLSFLKRDHLPTKLTRREITTLIISPLLFAAALYLFVAALTFGLASYSSALRRISILFVVLLAAPLLKERGHPERIWGGAIMTAGAILLAF